MSPDPLSPIPHARHAFQTTRWSLVMRAGEDGCEDSLAKLCGGYWYPIYAYVRRRVPGIEDAQDITQGFFLHLLGGPVLARADREKGKFRSFLLGTLQNYLANEHRHRQALKRGGGMTLMPIDGIEAERRFSLEPVDELTPEVQFERGWAFALLEKVFDRLGDDYARAGRGELYEKLRPYLAGKEGMPDYGELGAALGMNANAVGVAIHRMRRRYGEILRDEIAQTVPSAGEVEAELSHLIGIFSRV